MRDYLLALLRSFTLRISLRRPAEGSGHRPVAAHCEVLCFALSLGRPAHEHDRPRYCEVLCFAPSLRIKPLHSMADQTRIAELYVCAFVEENVYRLMHDDDEAGGAEGGSLGIHGVVGAEPSRRRPCESRNRRTGAANRGGAGVPAQSAGQQPAYQQDPYPGLHQRGGRHNPVRRRHHPGRAGRGQPIGVHHAHRQH